MEMAARMNAGRTFWSEEETRILIQSYDKFNRTYRGRDLWICIQDDLRRQGITKMDFEVRKKWDNLVQSFRRCHADLLKQPNSHKRPKFLFYERMVGIMQNKSWQNVEDRSISFREERPCGEGERGEITPSKSAASHDNLLDTSETRHSLGSWDTNENAMDCPDSPIDDHPQLEQQNATVQVGTKRKVPDTQETNTNESGNSHIALSIASSSISSSIPTSAAASNTSSATSRPPPPTIQKVATLLTSWIEEERALHLREHDIRMKLMQRILFSLQSLESAKNASHNSSGGNQNGQTNTNSSTPSTSHS
jgi:hypothetical protein